jgi:hypothetical protein
MVSLRKPHVDRVVDRYGDFSDDHNRNLSLRNEYGHLELSACPCRTIDGKPVHHPLYQWK